MEAMFARAALVSRYKRPDAYLRRIETRIKALRGRNFFEMDVAGAQETDRIIEQIEKNRKRRKQYSMKKGKYLIRKVNPEEGRKKSGTRRRKKRAPNSSAP